MPRILDFRERFRLRKIIYAKPTIIIMAIFAVLIFHSAWRMHEKSLDAISKRDKALEELHALETRKAELESDVARLSSDRGIEEEIRDRFMVAKEGEKVMIVVAPKSEDAHTVTVPLEQNSSFLNKIMSAVGLSGE